jgi:plastocyanin
MTSRNLAIGLVVAIIAIVVIIFTLSGGFKKSNTNNNQPNQAPNTVNIQNYSFNPSTLTVKKGTTVTWTNNDTTDHTITPDNNGFTSSQTLAPRQTYQFTFNNTGNFPYHCSIHTYMTANVVVE